MPNPFSVGNSVPPDRFVGRKSELDAAFDQIHNRSHLAIWGGPVSWRTATSFDATQAFIKALSPNPNRSSVLQGLQEVNLSSKDTSGDVLKFTSQGEREGQPILVKVEKGEFKLL
jgi:hypothetical protein